MTTEAYIAFLAANALLVYTPGPTMLLVVHYALTYGRQVGKYTIPAVLLGDIILRTTQKFKIAYNHRCSPIKYKEINANII